MIILDMKVDRLIACNILFVQWQIFYAYPGQEKWIKKTISSFSKSIENPADVNQWNAVRRFWITDEGTYKVIHTFKSAICVCPKSEVFNSVVSICCCLLYSFLVYNNWFSLIFLNCFRFYYIGPLKASYDVICVLLIVECHMVT